MKFRILFFICIIISSVDIASAQNLVTKKTYWDWGNSRLHESFTVIAGTGTRHGSYKEYDRNGMLLISANYNHGALHGLCIEYFGTPEKYISKSTNYLNGKKSGVEKNYNLGSSGHYLLEECIYKEDEMIEKTSYYTDAKNRGQKKSHAKLVDDKQYNANWFQNGQIEYKGILQVTPGNYGNITTPIQYTRYSETGILIEKLDDNIISFYAEDGKTITQKENLSTDVIECYDNGALTKSIKVLREAGNEYYEVSLYKDNEVYSKKIVDQNGNDVEQLRKEKLLELQYDSLYNKLQEILPTKVSMNIKEMEFVRPDVVYCRKGLYESSGKSSALETAVETHKKELDDVIRLRNEYTERGIKKNDGKYYKSIKLISEYIDKINRDFMQKYDTLSMMKKMVEQISDDLQCVECSYTYYRGQQGYKDNVPKIHKNAYNAYLATTEYLTLSLEGKNLSETLAILQQYATVSSKMRKWYSKKITPIEKLFKKAETSEAKLDIFLNNDVE